MVLQTRPNKFAITCLYRDPWWVGLNPQLALCQGLEVHIFAPQDHRGQERRTFILAVPPNIGVTGAPGDTPQGELNRAIEHIVTWHGATESQWHNTGSTDTQAEMPTENLPSQGGRTR